MISQSDRYELQETRHEDIKEIVEVSNLVFGPDIAFVPEELESQLEIFPEGQVCIKNRDHGRVAGFCSSLIVNFEDYGINHSLTWRNYG